MGQIINGLNAFRGICIYIRSIEIKNRSQIDFKRYPFSLPLFKKFDSLKFNENVTFIIGENGSGKSTLIEAIAAAIGINPEGGSRNFNFSTHATHSDLHSYLKVIREPKREKDSFFLRAESFYNVATEVERLSEERPMDSFGDKSLHEQSHGESFLATIQNRLRGNGIYIFDEPESALSPMRQMTLLSEMNRLVKERSQFIIATHSPIIMAFPGAMIYQISNGVIETVAYQETEHYRVTKDFLLRPEKMLNILLREE